MGGAAMLAHLAEGVAVLLMLTGGVNAIAAGLRACSRVLRDWDGLRDAWDGHREKLAGRQRQKRLPTGSSSERR
jgi:hypothetical protein